MAELEQAIKYLIFFFAINGTKGAAISNHMRREKGESNNIQSRLTLADWESYNYPEPQGPGTYAFGYDIEDAATDNTQFRNEERHSNGTVTGSYGYVMPDGNIHVVNYIADNLGYRASVETRPPNGVKPVVVNVENDISQALADAQKYNAGANYFAAPTQEQHVRPLNQQTYIPQNIIRRPNAQMNTPYNAYDSQAGNGRFYMNYRDISYGVNDNIATASSNAATKLLPNNEKSQQGQYRFYYVPY